MSEQSWSTCGLCNTTAHHTPEHYLCRGIMGQEADRAQLDSVPIFQDTLSQDILNTLHKKQQPDPDPGATKDILPLVMADYEARIRLGTQRYGQPLRVDNLRDHLQDAYEEALDQTGYLKAAMVLWEEMRQKMESIYLLSRYGFDEKKAPRHDLLKRLAGIAAMTEPYLPRGPRNGADAPGFGATS